MGVQKFVPSKQGILLWLLTILGGLFGAIVDLVVWWQAKGALFMQRGEDGPRTKSGSC
jgi:hypothetical protein